MPGAFATTVGDWVKTTKGGLEVVFKESVQELVTVLNQLVPVDTGFLRASLVASTVAMPVLSLENPGGAYSADVGEIMLVIQSATDGDTIYLGYTANYGAWVHYGTMSRPGRPWVDMAVQRWESIVLAKADEVKRRLGL